MEFTNNQKQIISSIQKGTINNYFTFALEFSIIQIHKISYDYSEKIKKGDEIYVLSRSGDIVKSLTNEFLDLIDYLNKRYISIFTKETISDKLIEPLLFIQTPEKRKKYERYPLLIDRFKGIFGEYFEKEFKPIKNELKKFIKRDFLSKDEYYKEQRQKLTLKLAFAAIIISTVSLIISTYFNYKASTSLNKIEISNPLMLPDTLKIKLTEPIQLKIKENDSTIIQITKLKKAKQNYITSKKNKSNKPKD